MLLPYREKYSSGRSFSLGRLVFGVRTTTLVVLELTGALGHMVVALVTKAKHCTYCTYCALAPALTAESPGPHDASGLGLTRLVLYFSVRMCCALYYMLFFLWSSANE